MKPRRDWRGILLFAALLVMFIGIIAWASITIVDQASAAKVPPAKAASAAFGKAQAKTHTAAVSTPPIVPFIRTLSYSKASNKACPCPAVFQLQRALKAAKLRPAKVRSTGVFGKATRDQIKAFQRAKKIPPSGVYGQRTHLALSKFYDKTGRARLQAVAHARKIVAITKAIVTVTAHAWTVRSTMAYSQSATRSILPSYPNVQRAGDCSSYVTWVFHSVGLPDPSGFGYRVIGYTGTLAQHGVRISAAAALHVGDLVFYGGGYPYGHVAIVVDAIRRLVSSHGSPGIRVVPFNYRPVSAIRRYF